MNIEIDIIRLAFSNVYVVRGERVVLIDTGSPGETAKLQRKLAAINIGPKDLAAIILTHAHSDHAGTARALRNWSGAKIMMAKTEQARAAEGRNGLLKPTRLTARFLKPLIDKAFEPFEADQYLANGDSLQDFGVDLHVLETPGHTAGSFSFISADRRAVVGDVLMGGMMGGAIFSDRARTHYFYEDLEMAKASARTLLDHGVKQFLVGHGGPIARHEVERWALKR